MYVISKKILDQLKENKKARIKLGYEFNRVGKTIDEWIDSNNPMLTTETAQRVIREELEIPETEEILEEQP